MWALFSSVHKDVWGPEVWWRSELRSNSSLLFCKMTVSVITSPNRQFQLRSRMEDLWEPDGLCSLTSSAESKNTGLASPRPALGEWRAAGPPISFPCPSQACQRGAKPKKSDLQWLLDRLGLEQCGNYGWQEGRCAVERRGAARRNHPVPKPFKKATKELKEK